MLKTKIKYLTKKKSGEENKELSKVYNLHKYWSRKPWHPIAESIKKHSEEGDLVLDMFLGSGVTALESVSLKRNFIGFDLNPMSIFIAESTILNHFNEELFFGELNEIKKTMLPLVKELYTVSDICSICGNNLIIQHTNIGPTFKGRETAYLFCFDCGKKTKTIRRVTSKELSKSFKKYKITNWVPNNKFPKEFYKDRFSYKGIKKVTDMYTPRNLYFLSELLHKIKTSKFHYSNLLLLAFSNTVLHASKLKGENVRPLNVNNYWVPNDYFEENPWLRFLDRIDLVLESKRILKKKIGNTEIGSYKLHNRSCFETGLKKNSVDYIITDPPYGETVQYSELSFMWNSWMNYNFNIKEEVVINPVQQKGIPEFLELLEKSVKEAHRVLKNGKEYTLCFHNKEFKIWKGVLDIFKKYDFVLGDINVVSTNGNSYNKNWAKFSPKTDLYLTFIKSKYKPTHNKEILTQKILADILKKNKENELTKIYDILSVTLINELYFNEYQMDLSKLTIKKIGEMLNLRAYGN
tara:strand:+ start:2420 stop:3985 length:1566 start_codon:yes stop_codon:yes gene_type:complete